MKTEERDRLADILRSGFSSIIRQADDWRPLANYVLSLREAAIALEREACAKVAESLPGYVNCGSEYQDALIVAKDIAAAIRARKD